MKGLLRISYQGYLASSSSDQLGRANGIQIMTRAPVLLSGRVSTQVARLPATRRVH
jgi:hypothetical protein